MSRPYVAILRAKQGELGAVKSLADEVKPFVRPLFELTPPTIQTKTVPGADGRNIRVKVPKDVAAHLADLASAINDASYGLTEVWVDDRTHRPSTLPATGQHPLTHFFSSLKSPSCPVIPVVGLHRDPGYMKAALEQASSAGSVVIRLQARDLAEARGARLRVNDVLERAGLKPSQAHLLLDIEPLSPGHIDLVLMGISGVLANIPSPDQWRTFTVATTALPDKPYGSVPNDSHALFERACWSMWKALQTVRVPRLPGFGDYGIDNPKTDLDREFYNQPVPMIRYTTLDHWAFFRGTGKPKGGGKRKTDWPDLAKRLIDSGLYRGKDFSAGDAFIQESADGAPNHSGSTQWRRAGVNHHITQVVEQLSSLP